MEMNCIMVIGRPGFKSKARLGRGFAVYQFSCLHAYTVLFYRARTRLRIALPGRRRRNNRIKISFFRLQDRYDERGKCTRGAGGEGGERAGGGTPPDALAEPLESSIIGALAGAIDRVIVMTFRGQPSRFH